MTQKNEPSDYQNPELKSKYKEDSAFLYRQSLIFSFLCIRFQLFLLNQ